MTRSAFGWPFTPPSRMEAMALARAAAYLIRTGNELETRRMTGLLRTPEATALADVPAIFHAAGHLCESVAGVD